MVDTTGEVLRPSDVADAVLYAVTAPWRVNISLLEISCWRCFQRNRLTAERTSFPSNRRPINKDERR